jgi:hypothetical protein
LRIGHFGKVQAAAPFDFIQQVFVGFLVGTQARRQRGGSTCG